VVNNETLLIEKLKEVRCGVHAGLCSITFSRRRQLLGRDLFTNIPFVLTIEIDSELYDTLGEFDYDGLSFLTALETSLSITHDASYVVSRIGGTVTVEIQIHSDNPEDPLEGITEDVIELSTNITSLTSALLSEFGGTGDNVLSTTLDLCPMSRTCGTSGNGACDVDTGVCECIGGWWGVNCETECTCNNGGFCAVAYCQCMYPYYGLRCDYLSPCSVCESPSEQPTTAPTAPTTELIEGE
jgi:hypothetical protein